MKQHHVSAKPVFSALGLVALGAWSPAIAGDVNCPPNLGAVTIDGNVQIAAPCELNGTTVKGNVLLYTGGSLVARNVSIDGNLQAENAFVVDIEGSTVDGDIQLDDMVGDRSRMVGNRVNGNIQLNGNRSRLEAQNNRVDGDVQAFSNSGQVVISDNVIGGNLQCKSNNPAPAGGNNRVSGNKEDQCANLQPEGSAQTTDPAPGDAATDGPVTTQPSGTSTTGTPAGGTASGAGGGGALGWVSLLALALAFFLKSAVRRKPVQA